MISKRISRRKVLFGLIRFALLAVLTFLVYIKFFKEQPTLPVSPPPVINELELLLQP